jgi:hypothetical protein
MPKCVPLLLIMQRQPRKRRRQRPVRTSAYSQGGVANQLMRNLGSFLARLRCNEKRPSPRSQLS